MGVENQNLTMPPQNAGVLKSLPSTADRHIELHITDDGITLMEMQLTLTLQRADFGTSVKKARTLKNVCIKPSRDGGG